MHGFVLFVCLFLKPADANRIVGVLQLDVILFDRVMPLLLKDADVLVKFDKEYPYGAEQQE